MSWTQVGENLVRYKNGTIYLRAKVAGQVRRVSLKTTDLRLAKLKREPKLKELRKAAALPSTGNPKTLGDALDQLEIAVVRPHLKASSRKHYQSLCARLRLLLKPDAPAAKWSAADVLQWWRDATARLTPRTANGMLRVVRLLAKMLVENGTLQIDPTAGIKAMRPVKRELALPSRQQLEKLIEEVRSRPHPTAAERADCLAFLAFSGCRIGEVPAIRWEDIRGEWLVIDGGETGTKSRKSRQIPISPALKAVLDRMSYPGAAGPIFTIYRPDASLTSACKLAGIPHLRIHDLRHWFASWAIENGIEIPTIARWLGHQDGGALLMRTYGHLRDQHSLDQAKKLK